LAKTAGSADHWTTSNYKHQESAVPTIQNYRGIIPAIACPFTADHRIDEPQLRRLASWLATQPGVVAVMTSRRDRRADSVPAVRRCGRHHRPGNPHLRRLVAVRNSVSEPDFTHGART